MGCATFMRTRTPNGVSGGAPLQFSAMDFSCVLEFAPLHYTSMQTMRHIQTYMHPQWCQRGCLISIFCHGFFLCAWMCSAALVCRRCATFIRTCTHDGVSWCASLRFLFGDHWLHQEAEDVRHSCVHAPPMVSAEVPFSAIFLCAWMCSAALHEYADDAPHSYVYAPLICRP